MRSVAEKAVDTSPENDDWEREAPETKIMSMTCTYRHSSSNNDSDDVSWLGAKEEAEEEETVDAGADKAGGDC